MRQSIFLGGGLALAVAFTIGSALAAYSEIAPFFRTGTTLAEYIIDLEVEPNPPGLSQRTELVVLHNCSKALLSSIYTALDATRQQSVNASCVQTASGILQSSPTNTQAFYVQALAAARRQDWETMNAALVNASNAAPNQSGFAYYRSVLAFDYRQFLSPEARTTLARDVTIAALSRAGMDWLARSYLAASEERPFLTDAMEKAPTSVQQRFLRAISAARS